MAHYIICEKEDLEAVGDVIRAKTGSSEKISLSDITTKVENIEPKLQSKTATPSASSQTIKPDTGYNGLSQVTVSGDANLKAENIAEGVSIFGVTGTHSGGGIETCTVDLASAYDWMLGQVIYSDGNELIEFFPNNMYDRMSLTVAKNTLLYIYCSDAFADISIVGDAELVFNNRSTGLIGINGDCSIDPISQ